MTTGLRIDCGIAPMDQPASGGTPTPTPPALGAEYWEAQDDFESPAGGPTAMAGRANWTGDLAANQWVTDNGVIHQNQGYGPDVRAFFGPAPDGWIGDFDGVFDYAGVGVADPDIGAWNDEWQDIYLWHADADNHIALGPQPGQNRLRVRFRVGGSNGNNMHVFLHETTAFGESGTIRVQIRDNKLRLWLNGKALKPDRLDAPWDHLPLSDIITDPDKRGGPMGVRQEFFRWPVLGAIRGRAADIECTAIDGAVGRDAHTGPGAATGTVTYSGWFSGSPVAWVARLIDAADGSTVIMQPGSNEDGWKFVTASVVGNDYSIEDTIPLGGPYYIEHGFLDANGDCHATLSSTTLVGYRIVVYGQSVAAGRGAHGSNAVTPLPPGACPPYPYNGSPAYPVGYVMNGLDPFVSLTSCQAWGFTNALSQIAGAPVIFEAYGKSGQDIAALMEGTSDWDDFVAAVATRKGVIEALLWDQGQGDADQSAVQAAANLANYPTRFREGIVEPVRAISGKADMPVLISSMGRYGSNTPPAGLDQATFDSQRDAFHKMQIALTAQGGGDDPDIHLSSHHNGIIYADSYHPTSAAMGGLVRLNERDAWSAARHVFGLPVHDGRGPIPTSVTRSGATLTIALDMNGATGLEDVTLDTRAGDSVYPSQPGNRYRGWDFSTSSGFAALLAVSDMDVGLDGTSLVVTLASDPGGPVYVRNYYGAGYDDSTLFRGTYSGEPYDGSIPVAKIMNADGWLVSGD